MDNLRALHGLMEVLHKLLPEYDICYQRYFWDPDTNSEYVKYMAR